MLFDLLENYAAFTLSLSAGTTIFSEGDPSDGMMFVVQQGEVDIFVRGERVETIGPGSWLGEVGLIDGGPRSATAVAKVDSRLVPIEAERFKFLVRHMPEFALDVMQTMAKRLRQYRDN